jgi:CHAD domain-containing protein
MNKLISEKPVEGSGKLLLEALDKGWNTYLAELERCRAEFSNEAVHDLRVATRRMITVIQLLNSILPRPRLKKIIRMFKDQLDELDELRDTQVSLAEISESLQKFPQLRGFQKRQKDREEKLLKSLRKELKNFHTEDLTQRIGKIHKSLEDEASDGMEAFIFRAVDDAYQRVRERLDLVDVTRVATIHRVRIAFKNFRYMVEMIYPLLDGYPEECLKAMHDYQSLMGDVQDAEVFLQTLNDYSENASFQDLGPARRHYKRRHTEAIAAYAEDMQQLHSFWRDEPDQPFPWEMKK